VSPGRAERRRAAALAAVVAAQAVCAAFFLADALGDLGAGWRALDAHTMLETAVAGALVVGVLFGALEIRRTLERQAVSERALRAARGAFAEVMDGQFDAWSLTAAERDVALMLLKGLDNDAIAALRGAAAGTVRAQTARIYAKAGVSGRAQFVSLFIEELLAEPLDA
jgi:DNA-binding CsgD family transcriptional regulator